MSSGDQDFASSAARQHEGTGGNVRADKIRLPSGGDAARKAEADGDAINEAYGVGAVPRDQYRGTAGIRLSNVRGARMVEPERKPDLSDRKVSDYLPPQLKAQLIAEGRLTPDGRLVDRVAKAAPPEPPPLPPAVPTAEQTPAAGIFAGVSRFFRKLFR